MNEYVYATPWTSARRELVERAIRAINVTAFPLEIRLALSDDPFVGVRIDMHANDRETGLPSVIHIQAAIVIRSEDVTFVTHQILHLVRSAVLHELDECTYVNGDRVFDPHVPTKKRGDAA